MIYKEEYFWICNLTTFAMLTALYLQEMSIKVNEVYEIAKNTK
jgi:hypothetical protein